MAEFSAVAVTIDEAQFRQAEELLRSVKGGLKRASVVAINRTARTGAVRMRRELAPLIGVSTRILGAGNKGMVRPLLANFDQANPVGGIRMLNFNLPYNRIKGARIGLAGRFATSRTGPLANQTNKTFQVGRRVKQKRGRLADPSRPIFVRLDRSRLPIKKVFVGSPRKAFESAPQVAAVVLPTLKETLRQNLEGQINRLLNRKKVEAA